MTDYPTYFTVTPSELSGWTDCTLLTTIEQLASKVAVQARSLEATDEALEVYDAAFNRKYELQCD